MSQYIHNGDNVYLDADGNVVKAGDPNAATLLVARGGALSEDDAQKYGLLKPADDVDVDDNEPKARAAAPNRARATEPPNKASK